MKLIKYCLFLIIMNSVYVLETKVEQCYCSDACGPRSVGEKVGDNPTIDRESGQCFCQQRDKDNYDSKIHPEFGGVTCKVKEKTSPSNFISFCDKNKN